MFRTPRHEEPRGWYNEDEEIQCILYIHTTKTEHAEINGTGASGNQSYPPTGLLEKKFPGGSGVFGMGLINIPGQHECHVTQENLQV